jgi:hypothetical protein
MWRLGFTHCRFYFCHCIMDIAESVYMGGAAGSENELYTTSSITKYMEFFQHPCTQSLLHDMAMVPVNVQGCLSSIRAEEKDLIKAERHD